MKSFKTIEQMNRNEIVIEKSRFITSIFHIDSVDDANNYLEKTRKEFYNATHNCFAYVIGENYSIQKFSDDGEPQGTAGIPILETIKQKGITNVLVIVTRYFGGIKLGAGGLTRAYVSSASECINTATVKTYEVSSKITLASDYSIYQVINRFLMSRKIKVLDTRFNETIEVDLVVKEDEAEKLIGEIINLTNNKVNITNKEEMMYSF